MKKIKSIIAFSLIFVACSSPQQEQTPNEILKKKATNESAFEAAENTVSGKNIESNESLYLEQNLTIKLTPFVPNYEGVGVTGVKILKDRLNEAITKIGLGGEGANPRFVIGPSVNLITQDITSTAPTKYACTYEINFMVVDVVSETVFNSYKSEFKGIGDSPEKAFISGIRNISYETQYFIDFLVASEKKIIEYFETNCNSLLSEADTEAEMRNYDNAFTILKSVPKESLACLSKIEEKKVKYFNLALNSVCNELLAKMKAELGKFNDHSASGFNAEAMNYFSMIDSKADCYSEAQKEYKKYISKLKPKAKRDWEQKMKVYNDQIDMVKAEKEFVREQARQAYDFKVKMAEQETKRLIEGNQKLLAKYKHDESPWIIRLFSSGSKLFKGELNTD